MCDQLGQTVKAPQQLPCVCLALREHPGESVRLQCVNWRSLISHIIVVIVVLYITIIVFLGQCFKRELSVATWASLR